MVIAFLRWNPFHHKLREKWGDDLTIGGEYNGYVAFSEYWTPLRDMTFDELYKIAERL